MRGLVYGDAEIATHVEVLRIVAERAARTIGATEHALSYLRPITHTAHVDAKVPTREAIGHATRPQHPHRPRHVMQHRHRLQIIAAIGAHGVPAWAFCRRGRRWLSRSSGGAVWCRGIAWRRWYGCRGLRVAAIGRIGGRRF